MAVKIDDILGAIEQVEKKPLRWVKVPGRADIGVAFGQLLSIAGPHKKLAVFFPDTGEVTEYATLVLTDTEDPRD